MGAEEKNNARDQNFISDIVFVALIEYSATCLIIVVSCMLYVMQNRDFSLCKQQQHRKQLKSPKIQTQMHT